MNDRLDLLCKAVGENVSRETLDRLTLFEQRFRAWNTRINLVADSTLDDLWSRHIADSAQLFALAPEARTWLDLGSGGGFPGLVVAFLLKQTDGGIIHLVESNRKKAAFLQSIAGEFDLPAHVHAIRIEDAVGRVPPPEVVTARALASLDTLLALASPWLSAGARALFHKGRDYRAEIEESVHNWRFHLIEHRSMVDPDSVILEIGGLERKLGSL
ncbi:MAG: 16S rRNA (guanine(527)-N(7))-methyltransferase RsmG [Rhizobiaceae bacterium]